MSTEAIRNELIDWINTLEDTDLLGSLLGLKRATQNGGTNVELSAEERRSIERGLEDLAQGRSLSSAEFWAKHGR